MSSKARVLLVDKDVHSTVVLRSLLREDGYDVELAHDARSAVVKALDDYNIELVLMDLDLEGAIDAMTITERILVKKDIPIIFRTASASDDLLIRLKDIPNYGCIQKDAGSPALIAAMEAALNLFRTERIASVSGVDREIAEPVSVESNDAEGEMLTVVSNKTLWLKVTSDAIITIDNNIRIRNWNEAATGLYGWTFNEVEGLDLDELLETSYVGENHLDAQITLAETGQWRGLVRQRHKNGSLLYIESSVTNLTAEDARMVGGLIVNRDVTASKQAQVDLIESQERFSLAFENAPIGMALATTEGKWMKVNNALCEITGYSREELMQLTFEDITYPADLPATLENGNKLLSGEMPGYTMEKRYIHRSGRVIWVNANVTLARKKTGEPDYFIAQLYDITTRKRAEEKLRALVREKEIILKEVHHRVKNNMNTVASMLAIQASKISDAEAADFLRQAIGRIRSMGILYDKLYNTGSFSEVNVKGYLEELVVEVKEMFGAPSVSIDCNFDDLVMPSGDVSAIGIIVNELLVNGIKHAFAGRDSGRMLVSLVRIDGQALLNYEDNGVGFDMQSDFAEDHFGMKLIELLTHQLHGELSAYSASGTSIAIRFPLS